MKKDRFEDIYEEHAGPLLAFLVYRTGDRSLAEEVLADTFERVLTSRARFDRRRGSEKTWVYSIALNRLRDLLRRRDAERRAYERTAEGAESGTADVDRVDDRTTVAAALRHLDESEREAVALRYGADLTVPEVARVLGVKVSTAEGRIYRGLRRMREVLEESPADRR
ncbi:MAG: RNA polymerase sigma factor [Solirubrobacterales bacterium]